MQYLAGLAVMDDLQNGIPNTKWAGKELIFSNLVNIGEIVL